MAKRAFLELLTPWGSEITHILGCITQDNQSRMKADLKGCPEHYTEPSAERKHF